MALRHVTTAGAEARSHTPLSAREQRRRAPAAGVGAVRRHGRAATAAVDRSCSTHLAGPLHRRGCQQQQQQHRHTDANAVATHRCRGGVCVCVYVCPRVCGVRRSAP